MPGTSRDNARGARVGSSPREITRRLAVLGRRLGLLPRPFSPGRTEAHRRVAPGAVVTVRHLVIPPREDPGGTTEVTTTTMVDVPAANGRGMAVTNSRSIHKTQGADCQRRLAC